MSPSDETTIPATRAEALRAGTARLAAAGIERPRFEARLLLAIALGVSQEALLADLGAPAPWEAFARLLSRRAAREPLALIAGRREFWSLSFAVSPATLIPRPDSETLIEAAIGQFPARGQVRRILDLGTGTGCLLLAALTEFPASFGVGVDRETAAAALARRNAVVLGLAGRSAFLAGDWTTALSGRFDLVLANPPYIESAAIAGLVAEVAAYEPTSALDGGPDGLAAYRAIVPALPGLLAPGGAAVLELGAGQAESVAALAVAAGLSVTSSPDLAGILRALVLRNATS
jgi:release factor glutamine methyltransferase